MTEIPLHWDKAMRKANIGDPRNGKPSMRALASKSGESPETIRRMVRGLGNPQASTVRSVADALGVSVATLATWVGQSGIERSPFVPEPSADLMTDAERKAVNRVIKLYTRGRVGADATSTRKVRRSLRTDSVLNHTLTEI